jgi:GT2 family glycosyltransferase
MHVTLDESLSIVIVTHNSSRHMERLLTSIREFTPGAQVIVFDNGSTDDTLAQARRRHPGAQCIASGKNLGFARGNNAAARLADRPFLLLLNADTCLLSNISPVIQLLQDSREIGVVGARMLGFDNEYRKSCGHFPFFPKLVFFSSIHSSEGPLDKGDFPEEAQPIAVDWVEGSFLLTRTDLWKRLGGLCEGYFMYVEDVDYCKRAKDNGFLTVYHPGVSYCHLGGFTAGRTKYLVAGYRKFNADHARPLPYFAALLLLTVGHAARKVKHRLCAWLGRPAF